MEMGVRGVVCGVSVIGRRRGHAAVVEVELVDELIRL